MEPSITRYALGLDVSKDDLKACLISVEQSLSTRIKASRTFNNNLKGIKDLEIWLNQRFKDPNSFLNVVIEATGVYHEQLAWALHLAGYRVCVLLPNKVKNYLRFLGNKSKNDKMDAEGMAKLGVQQLLEQWQPISDRLYELRLLTRRHENVQKSKTILNNQLEALEHGHIQQKIVMKQLRSCIKLLDKQLVDLKREIQRLIENDVLLAERTQHLYSIKGVGMICAATIIAETNGFALFKNQGQLISFAGYDVVENQSGRHTGKTRTSNKLRLPHILAWINLLTARLKKD